MREERGQYPAGAAGGAKRRGEQPPMPKDLGRQGAKRAEDLGEERHAADQRDVRRRRAQCEQVPNQDAT